MGPRTMLFLEQTLCIYSVQKRVQYYYIFIKIPNFAQELLVDRIIVTGCTNVYLLK